MAHRYLDLPPFLPARPHHVIVDIYQRLSSLRLRLNQRMVERLSRETMNLGAKRLGLLRGGKIVLDNEIEMAVLLDYCINELYPKGRNAVERLREDCPPNADSEEFDYLRVQQDSTFRMVVVREVVPGVGCRVEDLMTGHIYLLVDLGFAATAKPGLILATRLLDFGDFATTSGAALPVGIMDESAVEHWRRKLQDYDDREELDDPAPLIRECLQEGLSANMAFADVPENERDDDRPSLPPRRDLAQRQQALTSRRLSKLAATRRCRCGSGKMFKNCCGKR